MIASANVSTMILVKKQDQSFQSLVDLIRGRGESLDLVTQMEDAGKLLADRRYRRIFCDWRCLSCCSEQQQRELIGLLIAQPASLILVSPLQTAAVRFRCLEGVSVYCYRLSTLINRFEDLLRLSERNQQLNLQRFERHQANAPHYLNGLVVPFPQTHANWHLLQ
jgi:hypothetical protein